MISALAPNSLNLRKATEGARVQSEKLIPSVVAGARAVLSEKQKENGVAVIDLGAATTGVAIFEDGDLQYVGVLPVGANNITNDLAIVLQIDTSIAEDIKRRFAGETDETVDGDILIRHGKEELVFSKAEIDEIIEARLSEIFEGVRKELKAAKYDHKLPEGMVLIGGGANLNGVVEFAKQALEASIKIGIPTGLGGVADAIEKPEYAAAIGLAITAVRENGIRAEHGKSKKGGKSSGGLFSKLFHKF